MMRRKKSDDWARFLKQMMIVESECIEENYGEGRGLNDSDEENNAETRRDFASLQAMLPTLLAAPELLAACKQLHNCLSDWMEIADSDDLRDSDSEAIKLSVAAIAKAEGRSDG
jgi:hypothetical protein